MPAYHQMGHNSRNLLGEVKGYRGAIISPVNEEEQDVESMVAEHASDAFSFIFDPQMYFPQRADRGKLATWDYFPKDLDTADLSNESWWTTILDDLCKTVVRVGVDSVCSPATVPPQYSNDYYEAMRANADRLVDLASGKRVLETVLVPMDQLAAPTRSFEVASIVSNTKASGIYLILLSDVKPREELREVEQLKGAMRLIRVLEEAGLPVLVACSSSDVLLWKAAGATSCATGKFANLRRFTTGRFNEPDDGGRQMAYWFEEALLAFLRASDLPRVQEHGFAVSTDNPFGAEILAQLQSNPGDPWVRLGWRQYMHWFADMESRLAQGTAKARDLIRTAEGNWQTLETNDVFMEERANDGAWLRPWLRAVVEYNK